MDFGEKITALCREKLAKLGKMGKPNENKYILLACFVEVDATSAMRVVALGTGSKCIGGANLPCDGTVLHDSHAEIIARRAFKLYLLHEIDKCLSSKASIFTRKDEGKLKLKTGFCYHLYTSQTPCGDGSIIPKVATNDITLPAYKKLKTSQVPNDQTEVGEPICDIYRTGAKVIDGERADDGIGENYHTTGVLRIKPGRGNRTLSHCCSDKMFKWTVLGVQGALVMHFIKYPIYLTSIVVDSSIFKEDVFYRALHSRFKEKLKSINFPYNYSLKMPKIMQYNGDLINTFSKGNHMQPSPTSIIWSDTPVHLIKHECSVNGKKLGITKKQFNSDKGTVSICRKEMAKFVINLMKKHNFFVTPESAIDFTNVKYFELKNSSVDYYNFWTLLKTQVLSNWTKKPDFVKSFIVK